MTPKRYGRTIPPPLRGARSSQEEGGHSMIQSQTAAGAMLAKQIRGKMKNYVFPPEILDNLTDAELLALRAMSKAMKKEKPQMYAGVKDAAIGFLRSQKKAKA
jgi:hypothetical protein